MRTICCQELYLLAQDGIRVPRVEARSHPEIGSGGGKLVFGEVRSYSTLSGWLGLLVHGVDRYIMSWLSFIQEMHDLVFSSYTAHLAPAIGLEHDADQLDSLLYRFVKRNRYVICPITRSILLGWTRLIPLPADDMFCLSKLGLLSNRRGLWADKWAKLVIHAHIRPGNDPADLENLDSQSILVDEEYQPILQVGNIAGKSRDRCDRV